MLMCVVRSATPAAEHALSPSFVAALVQGLRPSFRNYSDVYGVFLKDGGATGARQSAPLLPAGKGAADDDDGSWGVKVDSDLLVRVEGKVEGGSVVQSSRCACWAATCWLSPSAATWPCQQYTLPCGGCLWSRFTH